MKKISINLHQWVDRVIVGTLLVFAVVVALLTFALVRHTRWQQAVTSSGVELRGNVEDLQEATNVLQETIDQLRAEEVAQSELDMIDRQLTELDSHLDVMEQTIAEVSPILGEEASTTTMEPPPDAEEVETIQNEMHGLFNAAAWLIGITSVVMAIIAFIVLNPKSSRDQRHPSLSVSDKNANPSDSS